MPKFNVAVNHDLPRDDVVARLKRFSVLVREDMSAHVSDLCEEWDDEGNLRFSFSAMGFDVSGNVVACSRSVTVIGDLPFVALPFRGAIESQIIEKIREAIG